MVTTAPYGSWRSPLGVEDLTAGSTGLDAVRVDGDDLYWLESRPDQGGRVSLWTRPFVGGEARELTPPTANVRTRVNEYGGGEYGVRDGVVVYSDLADGRLVAIPLGESVAVVTLSLITRVGRQLEGAPRRLLLAIERNMTQWGGADD